MNALTSAFLVGIAQISKIILGLFFIKIVAIYLGSEGLGKLGHLISLMTFLTIFAGGGIHNGIIKYISEYQHKPFRLIKFINTASSYSLIISIAFLFLLTVFSQKLAFYIFSDSSLFWFIILVGFFHALLAFNSLITSIGNGLKDTRIFSISQTLGNLLAIPLIWWMIFQFGIIGGAFAILTNIFITFLVCFYFFKKSSFWKKKKFNLPKIKLKDYSRLYGFSLMAITSATVFPLVEIYIRQMIIGHSGYAEAGVWQAATKISSVYIGLFALFLAYHFVPTISPENEMQKIRELILKYIIIVGSIFAIGAIVLYIGRDYFIMLVLSDDFLILSDIIYIQLIGDFFKIIGFVIGFVFVAKAFTLTYIFMEILQGLLLILLTSIFYTSNPEIINIFKGYAVTNLAFLIALLITMRWFLTTKK